MQFFMRIYKGEEIARENPLPQPHHRSGSSAEKKREASYTIEENVDQKKALDGGESTWLINCGQNPPRD